MLRVMDTWNREEFLQRFLRALAADLGKPESALGTSMCDAWLHLHEQGVGTYTKWKRYDLKTIPIETLAEVAKVLKVSQPWLVFGIGDGPKPQAVSPAAEREAMKGAAPPGPKPKGKGKSGLPLSVAVPKGCCPNLPFGV